MLSFKPSTLLSLGIAALAAFSSTSAVTIEDTIIKNSLPWKSLPPTPTLPEPSKGHYAHVNGIKLWYNIYGKPHKSKVPVILIHGGNGNSNYWGNLIRLLMDENQVITVDSRGQGRSEWGHVPMSYDLMTSDYRALVRHLKIPKLAWFGWSDGGIISINMASKHPEVVDRVFAFASHYSHTTIVPVANSTTFAAYFQRVALEYPMLNPHPEDQTAFFANISFMTATQPNWDASHFKTIDGKRVWYVGADHDEGVLPENHVRMFKWTPKSGLGFMPQVSHFGFLQNVQECGLMLKNFLNIDFNKY
jgi:pimeloyl-ACP methyl ester carboxylesterase